MLKKLFKKTSKRHAYL